MINIVFFVTPNYKNKKNQINVVYKKIDLLDQFLMAYNSIKKNWKTLNYDISLFYNKDYPFNKKDYEKLNKLNINIIPCEPDHDKIPYLCRNSALTYNLPKTGTHRLILDTDILFLKEPIFDTSKDWQAMFAGSANLSDIEYINKKYNYNLNLKNYIRKDLFLNYIKNPNIYKQLFPHFNAGAFLIKEELCEKFVISYKKAWELSFDKNISKYGNHIGIQYAQSFALIKLSENWKPFIPGINYLGKSYDIEKFGKENIILFHYCGVGGEDNVYKYFPEYLISQKK